MPNTGSPDCFRRLAYMRLPMSSLLKYGGSSFLLAALDLQRDEGGLVRKPPQQAIYLDVLGRTFSISFAVKLACLVLGFPVA